MSGLTTAIALSIGIDMTCCLTGLIFLNAEGPSYVTVFVGWTCSTVPGGREGPSGGKGLDHPPGFL